MKGPLRGWAVARAADERWLSRLSARLGSARRTATLPPLPYILRYRCLRALRDTSDHECVFVFVHPRDRCADAAGLVGCADDAECDVLAFEVCYQGPCTFVSCESDAERRAYLSLSETNDDVRAQCR